jgi:large subunit ribosomal protein L3
MVQGIIGRKIGMAQIYDEEGRVLGVTVVEAGPCTVMENRRGSAVQLGFAPVKESKVSKPLQGLFKKVGAGAFRVLRDMKVLEGHTLQVGQEIRADIFSPGEVVKVTGTSKGKGFAGVIKRWNFGGGRETHGSRSHRIPGSVGQCATPGRVLKGQKMPGRMGGSQVTAPTALVVDVRADENLVLLKGPIPGPNGGIVLLRKR